MWGKTVFLWGLILSSLSAMAAVPQMVNYQGKLTDADGNIRQGSVNLSFEIYDGAASGATKKWGPQVFNNVPLIEGSFNVI